MKLPLYVDFKERLGDKRLLPRIQNDQIISTQSIPFYYPIFWAPELRFNVKNLIIPKDVLESINQQKCKLLIFNIYEGWAYSSIIPIVEKYILKRYSLDQKNVVYYFANYEKRQETTVYGNDWISLTDWNYPVDMPSYAKQKIFSKQLRSNKFLCLQRRPKADRLAIFTELYGHRDKGILTMGTGDRGWNIMDQIVDEFKTTYPQLHTMFTNNKLRKLLPLQYDIDGSIENPVYDTNIQKYFDSYLHIIAETWYRTDGQVFFSEKSFKPMLFHTPFVIFNSYNSLSKLRELGFETFGNIIDESYDDIMDDNSRLVKGLQSAITYFNQPKKRLNKILQREWPKLEHNYNNLKKLNAESTKKSLHDLLNALPY